MQVGTSANPVLRCITCVEGTPAGDAPPSTAHRPASPGPALVAGRHARGPLREHSSTAAPRTPGGEAPTAPAKVATTRQGMSHAAAAALHRLAASGPQAHRRNLRTRLRAENGCLVERA